MGITDTKDIIGWIIGIFLTGIISVIASIVTVIKAGKMIPREVKGADLNNISKEVSIANQYDELATKAVGKTLQTLERLDKLEADYETLEKKVECQDEIIKKQALTIIEQIQRLDFNAEKIIEQHGEIELLKCKLNNTEEYNSALIEHMKNANIIPPEKPMIKDCEELKSIRKREKVKTLIITKEKSDGS